MLWSAPTARPPTVPAVARSNAALTIPAGSARLLLRTRHDLAVDDDLDGEVTTDDQAMLSRLYARQTTTAARPSWWLSDPGRGATSGTDNAIGYAGYRFNLESGQYEVRFRTYSPTLGRWMQRDPLPNLQTDEPAYDFVGGVFEVSLSTAEASQLYLYAVAAPGTYVDPSGLCIGRLGTIFNKAVGLALQYAKLLDSLGDTGLLPGSWDGGMQFYRNNPKQHCVWNCRMTKRMGAEFAEDQSDKKETLDIQMCDLLMSLGSCKRFLPSSIHDFMNAHCQSAMQPSDFRDNAAGRQCGCDPSLLQKYESCEDCCKGEFGIDDRTIEGPGSDRPYGPWWDSVNGRPVRPGSVRP